MPKHLAFPLRLASDGTLAANEQDSDDEIASCIGVICAFPEGHRRGSPRFGIPEMLFTSPDTEALRAAVARNEPRAQFNARLLDEALTGGIAKIDLDFDPINVASTGSI